MAYWRAASKKSVLINTPGDGPGVKVPSEARRRNGALESDAEGRFGSAASGTALAAAVGKRANKRSRKLAGGDTGVTL